VRSEPEVLWIDIDKLLHERHAADQRVDCVSSELEAKLVISIVHRLTQVVLLLLLLLLTKRLTWHLVRKLQGHVTHTKKTCSVYKERKKEINKQDMLTSQHFYSLSMHFPATC